MFAPHMSASGGKADMTGCGCPLLRPLPGVKRTCPFALHMSASDPKRTCADTIRELRQCSRKAIPTGVDFAVGSSRNRITLHLMVRSSYKLNTVIREVPISSGRKRHATRFCISDYLHDRPRPGGTTSQGAKLVGCRVKIASGGTKPKPNPTGRAESLEQVVQG